MTLDEYFATGPAHERPVFDTVMAVLGEEGPIHVEPVSVGIFLKNPAKVCELRPMRKWVAVSFSLSRKAEHRTIVRKPIAYGGRYWMVANVTDAAEIDDRLADLLREAYRESGAVGEKTTGIDS